MTAAALKPSERSSAPLKPAEVAAARDLKIELNVRSYQEGHASGKAEGMAQVLAGLLKGLPLRDVFGECQRTHPRVEHELRIRGFKVCPDGTFALLEACVEEPVAAVEASDPEAP